MNYLGHQVGPSKNDVTRLQERTGRGGVGSCRHRQSSAGRLLLDQGLVLTSVRV